MVPLTPAEVADFGRRLWEKFRDDDVLFLAGGVAFNILLAGVPFFLLLASGLGYALGATDKDANNAVAGFVLDFFPASLTGTGTVVDPIIRDITNGNVAELNTLLIEKLPGKPVICPTPTP